MTDDSTGSKECFKNPMAMRVITNLILTVSDMDVFFSILFMMELSKQFGQGIEWKFYFGLIIVGEVTYLGGACYFGPKQKRRVMKQVQELMVNSPDVFESATLRYQGLTGTQLIDLHQPNFTHPDNRPVMVTPSSPIFPPMGSAPRRHANGPSTIGEMDPEDKEQQALFYQSMQEWGVVAVFIAQQMKNKLNSMEVVHALPLVRTARFGFMAVPSPGDLAGLLNANALYSFATGLAQLAFGTLLVCKFGVAVERLMPMCISAVSLIICILNVVFDFGAVLQELEAEQQEANRILMKLEGQQNEKRREADNKLKTATREVEQKFKAMPDTEQNFLEKKAQLDAHTDRHTLEVSEINDRVSNLVRRELTAFKESLVEKKQLLNGNIPVKKENQIANQKLRSAEAVRDALAVQERNINDKYASDLANLTGEEPDYLDRMRQLQEEKKKKIGRIEGH